MGNEIDDLGAFLANHQFEQDGSKKARLIANIISLRNAASASDRALHDDLVSEFKRKYKGDPYTIILDKDAKLRLAVRTAEKLYQKRRIEREQLPPSQRGPRETFLKAAKIVSEDFGIPFKTISNSRYLK